MSYEHTKTMEAKKTPVRALTFHTLAMCALAAIFYCYEYYLRVAPSVMKAELQATFNLSDAAFGLLAAYYYYAYTPMQIPVGMLLDKFGPRLTLTFACLICALGTYAFAHTDEVILAQVGRFFVGFGSAFAYVGVLKISDIWLPKKYFAFMAGLATTLGMLGAIFGQLTMASLVARIGWQATLSYSIWTGLVLTVILWLVLKDNPKVQSEKEFHDTEVKLLAGLLKMCRNREMWINGLIGCLTFLPISAFAELWAVPYLETVGFDRSEAALGSSMIFIGFSIGGPLWGILSDKLASRRLPLIVGSFLSAIAFFILILFPMNLKLWMYSWLFIASLFTSAQILVFAVSNDENPKYLAATAAAFTNMVVMIGGMFLPPIIGKILDMSIELSNGLPNYSAENYKLALMVLPVGLVLSGILSYFLKESYKKG